MTGITPYDSGAPYVTRRTLTVTVRHLSYYVEVTRLAKKRRKALLRDVSMCARPGELTYLMGPSGAGKSTLLDVLAGRVQSGILSGGVFLNGATRNAGFWRESAYVRQDDVHLPALTVQETMSYAARLRMGEDCTDVERRKRVASVAALLGLDVCTEIMCGDATLRGISGGQRKRLSIAVEIMSLPTLIFLDEPTSGLDSVTSHEVMSFVQKLARQGRTVICTIHQPSPETFALSSTLVLLASGRVCFFGPSQDVSSYFQSPALSFPGQGFSNPADFIMAVVSGSVVPTTGTRPLSAAELAEAFNESVHSQLQDVGTCINGGAELTRQADSKGDRRLQGEATFPTSTATQCRVLLHRNWVALTRQKQFVRAQIGKNILVALVCGVIFAGQGRVPSSKQFTSSSFNLSSLLYFAMMYTVIGNLQAIPQLFAMRVLYVRERAASVYSTLAYWLAGALVNLPLLACCHVLFLNICYWIIGLPPNLEVYGYTLVVTLCNNLVAFYFSQFLAAAAPTEQAALAIFPVTFLFLTSFAGFTVPIETLPKGWRWASYVSYPRWCYEGLLAAHFSVRPDAVAALEQYGFSEWRHRYWLSVPILLVFMVAMNVLVYWGLRPQRSRLRYESDPAEKCSELSAVVTEGTNTVAREVEVVGGETLREKLLSADDRNLQFSALIPWTLPGLLSRGQEHPVKDGPRAVLSVQDYQMRSVGIQRGAGVRLLFRDVSYALPSRRSRRPRVILKGVSGRVGPGEMCALMGGSGAGKSTLLDVLAGRKTTGTITGEVYLNARQTDVASSRCSSYVTQDNVHIGSFTVRETLHFAAMLRINEPVCTSERMKRVDDVMRMLGLDDVAHVLVGDPLTKGISGGQVRRLTIGVEIINLPDLIFLDEPTTGLDSSISYEVMAAVRNLATNQDRTIVCTIHQPSVDVFALFDKLILLSCGLQVYYGSTHEAVKYFSSPTLDFEYVKGTNVADFVVAAASGLTLTRGGVKRDAEEMAELYASSDVCMQLLDDMDSMAQRDLAVERGVRSSGLYPRALVHVTCILNWRNFKKLRKNRRPVVVAVVRHILVALFYGSLYWQLDATAMQSRMSLLFFAIMFVMIGNQQSIPIIYEDRLLYYREKGAKVYGAYSYWMTCATAYIPQNIVNTLLYSSIVYHMAGLNTNAGCFWFFWLVVMLSSICALCFCQLLSVSLPNSQTTVATFPAVLFLFIAFAGFIVRLPSLPVWLGTWCPDVSFARWAFQALLINELHGNPQVSFAGLPTMYYTPDPYHSFLASLGFDGFDKWYSVPILLLNIVVFRVLTLFALAKIDYENR